MLRKLGGEFENLKMRIVRFNHFLSVIRAASLGLSLVVGRSTFVIFLPSVRTVASLVSSFDF
jgi:hypothetical protein